MNGERATASELGKMLHGRQRRAYGRIHIIYESDFISMHACRLVVIENLMTSEYFRPKMQADLMSVDSEARSPARYQTDENQIRFSPFCRPMIIAIWFLNFSNIALQRLNRSLEGKRSCQICCKSAKRRQINFGGRKKTRKSTEKILF